MCPIWASMVLCERYSSFYGDSEAHLSILSLSSTIYGGWPGIVSATQIPLKYRVHLARHNYVCNQIGLDCMCIIGTNGCSILSWLHQKTVFKLCWMDKSSICCWRVDCVVWIGQICDQGGFLVAQIIRILLSIRVVLVGSKMCCNFVLKQPVCVVVASPDSPNNLLWWGHLLLLTA